METLGLGIDAGGTQTRWALARRDGSVAAEGVAGGVSALQLSSSDGRAAVQACFAGIAAEVLAVGQPQRVHAGMTGFGGESGLLAEWLASAVGIPRNAVSLSNDIEIAFLDSFAPGEGYLVYAGTGSIGAFIDADGEFHRAGGRGVVLDDGGGGFWIAREALRLVWRREDEQPGAWRASRLARALFDDIGGDDWSLSRQFIYGQERGAVGKLALAVARVADDDEEAAAILRAAGEELARLARALTARFGPRPVVLAGRAAQLHPLVFQAMRAALPDVTSVRQSDVHPHYAAARMAAR
jgi:N-acetylglucosamine kinase-like BadF-type ATPase